MLILDFLLESRIFAGLIVTSIRQSIYRLSIVATDMVKIEMFLRTDFWPKALWKRRSIPEPWIRLISAIEWLTGKSYTVASRKTKSAHYQKLTTGSNALNAGIGACFLLIIQRMSAIYLLIGTAAWWISTIKGWNWLAASRRKTRYGIITTSRNLMKWYRKWRLQEQLPPKVSANCRQQKTKRLSNETKFWRTFWRLNPDQTTLPWL